MKYKSNCFHCRENYSYEESWWAHNITYHFKLFIDSANLDFECMKCKKAFTKISEAREALRKKTWKKERDRLLQEIAETTGRKK